MDKIHLRCLSSEDAKEIAFSLLDLLRETQFVPLVCKESLQIVSRCIEVLPLMEALGGGALLESCGCALSSSLPYEEEESMQAFSLLREYFSTLFSAYVLSKDVPDESKHFHISPQSAILDLQKLRKFLRPFSPEFSYCTPLLFDMMDALWPSLEAALTLCKSTEETSSEAFVLLQNVRLALGMLAPEFVSSLLRQITLLFHANPSKEGCDALEAICHGLSSFPEESRAEVRDAVYHCVACAYEVLQQDMQEHPDLTSGVTRLVTTLCKESLDLLLQDSQFLPTFLEMLSLALNFEGESILL